MTTLMKTYGLGIVEAAERMANNYNNNRIDDDDPVMTVMEAIDILREKMTI